MNKDIRKCWFQQFGGDEASRIHCLCKPYKIVLFHGNDIQHVKLRKDVMNVQPGQNANGEYQAVFQVEVFVGSEPAPHVAEGKRYDDDKDVVFDIHEQHKSDQQHDNVQKIMFFLQ